MRGTQDEDPKIELGVDEFLEEEDSGPKQVSHPLHPYEADLLLLRQAQQSHGQDLATLRKSVEALSSQVVDSERRILKRIDKLMAALKK